MVCKLQIDDVAEVILHKACDNLPKRCRLEVLALLHDVVMGGDGGDGRRVSGRAADALLLHRPNQRGFGIAGRRLGKLLLRYGLVQKQLLPLLQIREQAFGLFLLVVGRFFIDGGIAGELQGRGVCFEKITAALHFDGKIVIDRVCHLAGGEPAPDDSVEAVLFLGQILADQFRGQGYIRRADGLVGVLGAGLRFEAARLFRAVGRTVSFLNEAPRGSHRLIRQAQGVGTHIADQTDAAVAGDLDAFVELLRHRHGAPRRHVQAAGGLLLQGGGDKGRRGRALFLRAFDAAHGEGGFLYRITDHLDLVLGMELHLLLRGAVEAGTETVRVLRLLQEGIKQPVFLTLKRADLVLAVHHHARRHRLDPSGGQAALDLLPEQG